MHHDKTDNKDILIALLQAWAYLEGFPGSKMRPKSMGTPEIQTP